LARESIGAAGSSSDWISPVRRAVGGSGPRSYRPLPSNCLAWHLRRCPPITVETRRRDQLGEPLSYACGMSVVAAFSISPLGGSAVSADGSVGPVVAEVVRMVRESGLANETNAMFTNVEGDLEAVLDLIRRCVDHVASIAPRVSVVVKLDVRSGRADALHEKVASVERWLGEE
jgi:uncharacterized protein YqgV (UPF0045/DUF77 family)